MAAKALMVLSVASMCVLSMGYLNSMLTAARVDTMSVLVARGELPRWSQVDQPKVVFQTRKVRAEDLPAHYIPLARIDEVRNRVLIRSLRAGQVLTWDDVLDRNQTTLDIKLSHGKRAVAIPTSDANQAALALPGARVDVILTSGSGAAAKVEYLVENVVVIAPAKKNGADLYTITVEVTPEEALKLAHGLATGKLMVALRPFGEGNDTAPRRQSVPKGNRVTSPPVPVEVQLPEQRVACAR